MTAYICARAPCLFPHCQCETGIQIPENSPLGKIELPPQGWYCPGCRSYHAPTCTTCPAIPAQS